MESQTTSPEIQPSTEIPLQPAATALAPVAPWWHTVVLVLALLGIGLLSAWGMKHTPAPTSGPLAPYLQTIVMQWLLFAFVVWGMRRNGTSIAEIMGRPWRSFDDALVDTAIAGAVFIASLAVRAVIVFAMMRTMGSLPSVSDAVKSVERLIPRTPAEIGVAMLLAITAGIVEEFIFRGYLQRQFTALTNNVALGILLSLAVFFVGHLYQGITLQLMFVALLGLALGVLAHWRKNLRPGIILHAGQDMISLLFLSIFAKAFTK